MTLTAERTPLPTPASENNPYVQAWESQASDLLALEGAPIDNTVENVSNRYDITDSPIDDLAFELPATERASTRLGDLLRRSADRADGFSDSLAERKDMITTRLRGIGRSALTRSKDAGMITLGLGVIAGEAGVRGVKIASEKTGDAMMNGFAAVETGMDKAGTALINQKAKAVEGYQTFQFNREKNANNRQFKKDYAKETKAFDKNAAKEAKVQAKQDKREIKAAGREDKQFERSMNKKVALERRAERRARWNARLDTIKQAPARAGDAMMNGFAAIETGMDVVGQKMVNAKELAVERAESAKRKARIARTAGKMALQTYRDTSSAFKNN